MDSSPSFCTLRAAAARLLCVVLVAVGLPACDLQFSMSVAPDPVPNGDVVTYTITVSTDADGWSSTGSIMSSGVCVTDVLPPGLSLVSVTPSQGLCTGSQTVTCQLGTLPPNGSATILLAARPTSTGVFHNEASVADCTYGS